ncbi:hypothetical protein VTN96DRAFT_5986 [Rasamsonia emersonii]
MAHGRPYGVDTRLDPWRQDPVIADADGRTGRHGLELRLVRPAHCGAAAARTQRSQPGQPGSGHWALAQWHSGTDPGLSVGFESYGAVISSYLGS